MNSGTPFAFFNISWILLAGILIVSVLSCENRKKRIDTSANITPEVTHSVTIYGSENCDHCIEFRSKMDSAKLGYEFKDAEANERYYSELILKMQQANSNGYISFPVLDIDGKIYVRPEFADIVQLLKQ